jgi:hypothetical protein
MDHVVALHYFNGKMIIVQCERYFDSSIDRPNLRND